MQNLLFPFILLCSIVVPVVLHKPLKRKIKSQIVLNWIEGIIGLVILSMYFVTPWGNSFSLLPEYPKVTKKINDKYYFTQQEFGWAGSMPGKHLEFFERNKFWFDKSIGHIKWRTGTTTIEAEMDDMIYTNNKRIKLNESGNVVLDTLISSKNRFDFEF